MQNGTPPGFPGYPQQAPGQPMQQPGFQQPPLPQTQQWATQPGYAQQPQQRAQPGYAQQPQAVPVPSSPHTRASLIASVLATEMGNRSGDYFSDDNGRFDGDYVVQIEACKFKDVEKGQAYIVDVKVLEATTPAIPIGSQRNLFFPLYRREAKPEMHEFWAMLAAATGYQLSPQWVDAHAGEAQIAKGILLHLTVNTKSQKKDTTKTFTHIRWRALAPGEQLNLAYRVGAQPQAAAMPQANAYQQPPAMPPMPAPQAQPQQGFTTPVAPANPGPAQFQAPAGYQIAPPPGFPAGMPWPGAPTQQ